eukprot:138124-Hanusia_phi.AAC.3
MVGWLMKGELSSSWWGGGVEGVGCRCAYAGRVGCGWGVGMAKCIMSRCDGKGSYERAKSRTSGVEMV